jgi:hypothetical protein
MTELAEDSPHHETLCIGTGPRIEYTGIDYILRFKILVSTADLRGIDCIKSALSQPLVPQKADSTLTSICNAQKTSVLAGLSSDQHIKCPKCSVQDNMAYAFVRSTLMDVHYSSDSQHTDNG